MANIINLQSHLISGALADQKFYEVPNAGMKVIEAVINATWDLGNQKSNEAYSKMTTATQTGGFLDTAQAPSITAGTISLPSVTAPNVTIPTNIDTTQIISTFDAKYADIANFLTDEFTGFISTYAPGESAVYTAAQNWISAALANPTAGLPATVQAQLLGEDQARVLGDKVRAQDAVIAQFAGRRFPLPPDAAASIVLQIEQKAQDELAASGRNITKLSIEQMRFVIERALDLRKILLGEAVDYIKALASAPDIASKVIGVGYDAQSKLISAAAQFYGADTQAHEMVSKVQQYNNSLTFEKDAKNQAVEMEMIKTRADAFMRDLQLLAQQATALFNNLHASVGMSTGGNTTLSPTA